MPRVSEFYGIKIAMFFNDHAPPHFHAAYSGQEAMIAIETLEVLEGRLPPRVTRLVREWARLHRIELRRNWERACESFPLDRIPGLE